MLGGTGFSAGPSGISSLEKGFSLCLFSPGWFVEVVGGVSSYLSLFLVLSSLARVCNTGISTAFS